MADFSFREDSQNLRSKINKTANIIVKLDGCIAWNAHNTVLGGEALLIYIVPVCYVKQVGMERPSNIIISLHWKNFFQLLRIFH